VRRAVLDGKAKKGPQRRLCVPPFPSFELFAVLLVLGSSKVLEFGEAHTESHSGTRFGDESMKNLCNLINLMLMFDDKKLR